MSKINSMTLILAIIAIAVVAVMAVTYVVNDSDSEMADVNILESKGTYEEHAKVGEKYALGLSGNVTTGYDWKLVSSDGLKLINDWYKPNDNPQNMCGVGGVHYFEFDCAEAGIYDIVLDYQRSWEGSEGNIVTMHLIVE